ncbi:hypothetical protein MMC18_007285 [Xylographa bjoerkii]|nr:hypothetical protein [Xylographa bjoerkii]
MIPVSTRSGEAQKQWIERVQTRLTITSSMLNDMRAVKMLGLTNVLSAIISNLRKIEISTSVRFRKLLIWQVALSNVPTDLAPFATFAIYTIISVVRQDSSLLSAQAFTSLALISLLTTPLLTFCQAMPSVLQAVFCFNRIEEYCKIKSSVPSGHSTSTLSFGESSDEMELRGRQTTSTSDNLLVSFKNATVSRSSEPAAVLHGLNLSIRRGITMIIGPVGCGKSTLIDTILGSSTLRSGSATVPLSRVAYCPQNPWIVNNTIRHNIIGATEFDWKWYDFTLSACCLEEDIRAMPRNDMRMAGSNGIALSGGQKQRVALARAVYSRLGVVVLDNIFSGLDSKSIALISDRLFSKTGHFRKAGISVILATNTYHMLPYADEIIVLEEGRIVDKSSHEEILARTPENAKMFGTPAKDDSASIFDQSTTGQIPKELERTVSNIIEAELNEGTDHIRQQGALSVYIYYVRSAGYIPVSIFAVFTVIEAFSSSFGTLWLQWWVEANEQQPNKQLGMYLGVYGLIFALSLLGLVAGCWMLFVRILHNTSINLHSDLLTAALRAPISFFMSTDTGTTTNRFSQDMELIDMMLPIYAVNFATGAVTCVIKLIILCAIGKYLAGSVPVLAVVLFFVQSYYLRTSRQVRLLDIEAKAPLYTHFLETIQGISTIRAFNWEGQYREQGQRLLNQSQKPVYMLFCIQQWLTLVLDLVVGAIAIILVAMITSLKDRFSAASIGVALNLLLTFNETLTQAIKMWTMMETSIGAVSRVQRFVQETPSEEHCRASQQPPPHPEWPFHGAIEFQDVTAGYDRAKAPVLRHVNLTIQPGQKFAVCGPSGSGKTSLVMALLQMLEIQEGSVTIDGRDISTIERSDIRARLNVIPQDPFFLPGTTRFNLDPHQRVSDADIESAIKKVGLWDRFNTNGGLDMEFSALEWSLGQRQLLALARALIVRSPILILDEATSSVDWETESIMQEIIDREFARETVIAVVHRFRYIDRYDRVVVLKHGELLECDTWTALLERDSEFRKLYWALQKS